MFCKTYRIGVLADPDYAPHRTAAGGDLRSAVQSYCQHYLHILAHLPAGSAAAELRFVYCPGSSESDPQARLSIYMLLWAISPSVSDALEALILRGPLAGLYEIRKSDGILFSWERLNALCCVVRRDDFTRPLHAAEFNPAIPTYYYSITSFEPNENNDYLLLDRVLGTLTEHVIIAVRVEPTDVSAERTAHSAYERRLESINRSTDRESGDGAACLNYLSEEPRSHLQPRSVLEPLRYRDPLADDILQMQRRFHASLREPHLQFRICAFAESEPVAQLLGSVLAESAFAEGRYRVVGILREDARFSQLLTAAEKSQGWAEPFHKCLPAPESVEQYEGLMRLAHVAPASELTGAFRLPVAEHASPCCIRKKTDPVPEPADRLVVLGRDVEPRLGPNNHGLPRGIRFDELTKHCFVAGIPGKGKTTAVMNLLLQLAGVSVTRDGEDM